MALLALWVSRISLSRLLARATLTLAVAGVAPKPPRPLDIARVSTPNGVHAEARGPRPVGHEDGAAHGAAHGPALADGVLVLAREDPSSRLCTAPRVGPRAEPARGRLPARAWPAPRGAPRPSVPGRHPVRQPLPLRRAR